MNPYFILNMQADEVRFNRVLAYWLNPFESHGLKSKPGRLFLDIIKQIAPELSLGDLSVTEIGLVRTEVHLNVKRRVDIQMSTSTVTVWVESKIDSGQGENQIDDYADAIDKLGQNRKTVNAADIRSLLVFLTPMGDKPNIHKSVESVPVVPMSFNHLISWVNSVIAETSAIEQAVSLAQFREWITEVASPRAGGTAPNAMNREPAILESFWGRARDRLSQTLANSQAAKAGWVVAFFGKGFEESPFPHGEPYAKLAITRNGGVPGDVAMVAVEGIAGEPLRETPIIGIMRPFKRAGARQGQYTTAEELLTAKLASEGFRVSWHWIAYQRFAVHGWPSFHENDALTGQILANRHSADQLADEIADALFAIFHEHFRQLEEMIG